MANRDRWQQALAALIGAKGVDPRAFYLARVLRGFDNAADLDPELDAFPPMSAIPVRPFAPGVIVKPVRGRLCLFGFEHGDLARPFIAQFVGVDSGAALKVARDTDPVNLKLFVSPDLPTLTAHRLRLFQVFSNLIGNAIRHHDRSDGSIGISCKDCGDFYEFTVTDDGPGIDPEHHEKIFAIFQSINPQNSPDSTGIGLSIVKKIVETEGGTIRLESQLDQGATFYFTWPR